METDTGCGAGVVSACYRSLVDDDATGPMDLITTILRFHHILEARLDRALNGCGLSFAQYEVMEVLVAEPKLHAGELGRRLHITRQSAHGLLKQLARAGLIELLPKDGAIRCAWLTPAGRNRLDTCRRALESIERATAALPSTTARDLRETLSRFEAALVPRPRPWWLD
jgi:DNA-binding MarR family transcriptional regulator